MHRALLCLCLALPALVAPAAWSAVPAAQVAPVAQGVRLLMVVRAGCIYCERWQAEVGPGYATSVEGRAAPLAEVDIGGPWPDGIALASRPYITPTFILLRDGQEQARIEGYPGVTHFAPALREIMQASGINGGQG